MTVKELIEKLKTHPEDMDVFVAERKTDFAYGMVNSVGVKEIDFMEEPWSEPLAKDKVVVLDEE